MLQLPLYVAWLACTAAAQPAGKAGAKPNDAPPPLEQEDMLQILKAVLADSRYDANLVDQKTWEKPQRKPTQFVFRDDQKSFKLFGSPAIALAANTGINIRDNTGDIAAGSIVYAHVPSIKEIAGGNRGVAAFIFAHEVRHLLSHDPEEMEDHNLKHFDGWCANQKGFCEKAPTDEVIAKYTPDGDKARDAFLRPCEDRADLEARKWLKTLVDPKTGKPFGEKAAEEAVVAMGEWLKKHPELKTDGQHASIKERLRKLQNARAADHKSSAQIKAKGARAVDNATTEMKASKF